MNRGREIPLIRPEDPVRIGAAEREALRVSDEIHREPELLFEIREPLLVLRLSLAPMLVHALDEIPSLFPLFDRSEVLRLRSVRMPGGLQDPSVKLSDPEGRLDRDIDAHTRTRPTVEGLPLSLGANREDDRAPPSTGTVARRRAIADLLTLAQF